MNAAAVQKLFDELDLAGLGFLDRMDIQHFMQECVPYVKFDSDDVEYFFVKADCNRDGVIDIEEFSSAMSSNVVGRLAEVKIREHREHQAEQRKSTPRSVACTVM
mmetsp:Transcript_83175/g.184762  ORF Transcript_83175/g.184762 Transcript_83175/m.184762 type:complete len:105 (+) Transcript_83175:1-315(+)